MINLNAIEVDFFKGNNYSNATVEYKNCFFKVEFNKQVDKMMCNDGKMVNCVINVLIH